ncbi:hypothetical protein FOQG_16367 [Fusarium oxysporum f. sp. raphani 54005]|uniref:C2H2-type domain-containing protein n=1 Tax=Fusarium oxysporum f. sp. raphani 54005 TaxID=1089458 RepID=X0BA08_FUSOX|nr:hypothetical protein FOQG_16367 [Fusarium oxysporum f. sp. raphani 54005]
MKTEAPESFFCEVCGKNGFSRRDNLKTHRKLHARQPNRKCRVEDAQQESEAEVA